VLFSRIDWDKKVDGIEEALAAAKASGATREFFHGLMTIIEDKGVVDKYSACVKKFGYTVFAWLHCALDVLEPSDKSKIALLVKDMGSINALRLARDLKRLAKEEERRIRS